MNQISESSSYSSVSVINSQRFRGSVSVYGVTPSISSGKPMSVNRSPSCGIQGRGGAREMRGGRGKSIRPLPPVSVPGGTMGGTWPGVLAIHAHRFSKLCSSGS